MDRTEVARKDSHVSLCCTREVETAPGAFAAYELTATCLPELNLDEVSLSAEMFGRRFAFPIMISGMTGGATHARRINGLLADAAVRFQVPFGLGSLKVLLAHPELRPDFDVVRGRPELFAMGNFGAADLGSAVPFDDVRRLASELGLGAVALHLNALQECIQPEGRCDFSGVLRRIETCVRVAGVPVVVKEVGCGIGAADYTRLADAGVSAVDVAGRGGTSWSRVEAFRAEGIARRMGLLFDTWGISTPEAVRQCAEMREKRGGPGIVASGGIRSGLDAAVALALGADFCGVALPLLRAAAGTTDEEAAAAAVAEELEFLRESLRVALFCSGCRTPGAIRGRVSKRS